MDKLELPKIFEEKWDNLLILTYGAELPFFENTIWRLFRPSCPNKIILMDGKQYLKACENYVTRGMVRFLNQRYIVDGIFIPQAAHAKILLLTTRDKGCLLVGSGNLGHSGYASGGELFTRYDYDEKNKEHLPAFIGAWNFIQEIESKGYIRPVVHPYLKHMYEGTPWLFYLPSSDWDPIRHNLNKDLMTQFVEQVNNEQVEELWVLSPFYDVDCQALDELVKRLSPKKTFLLVQPGRTSVDSHSLSSVLSKYPGQYEIHPFSIQGDQEKTYVHAKLYLAKTKTRSICLQGSPNLSRAAMLLCPPHGNIEIANLLLGKPDSFGHLLEDLSIAGPASPTALDLSFDKPEKDDQIEHLEWYISGANWIGETLYIYYSGHLQEAKSVYVKIGNQEFELAIEEVNDQFIRVKVSEEARFALACPLSVSISLDQDHQTFSNPVSVCNIAALNKYMLEGEGSSGEIDKVGALDLEDQDFERLLGELDAALVIDYQSIWRGKMPSYPESDDEEAVQINYSDINYEQLRRHPKLQAYLSRVGTSTAGYSRSRLQIILSSISSHFDNLVELALFSDPSQVLQNHPIPADIDEYETEEEKEEAEKEQQKKHWSNKARLKKILRNFIRRFICGVKSPDFQEIAGYEVMARNYVIFTHILWRLLVKDQDWIEPAFVAESLQTVWNLFWGSKKTSGYFSRLSEDQYKQVIQLIREHHNDGLILAAIFCCEKLGQQKHWDQLESLRIAWRDFLRDLLSRRFFPINSSVLEDAWIFAHDLYSQTFPSGITLNLLSVVNYESQNTFLRSIEKDLEFSEGSCAFIRQDVWRHHLGRSGSVDCLVINDPNAIADMTAALKILGAWQNFQQKDYYRISTKDSSHLFYFDVKAKEGLLYIKDTGEEKYLTELPIIPQADWQNEMQKLMVLAKMIDNQLTMKVSVSSVSG